MASYRTRDSLGTTVHGWGGTEGVRDVPMLLGWDVPMLLGGMASSTIGCWMRRGNPMVDWRVYYDLQPASRCLSIGGHRVRLGSGNSVRLCPRGIHGG